MTSREDVIGVIMWLHDDPNIISAVMNVIDQYVVDQIESAMELMHDINKHESEVSVRKRAAQLRVDIDRDLGRETPEDIRLIADE